MIKQELFNQLISEQEEIIAQLDKAQARRTNDADLEEGATVDPDDQSHQSQSNDMATFYGGMKDDNKSIVLELKETISVAKEKVEHGAVVETEDIIFVIGISIPTTTFKGKKVLGVSAQSPVFMQNEHRNAAEQFVLKNKHFDILSIS